MGKIYRWDPEDRKVAGADWNVAADVIEDTDEGHVHNGVDSRRFPETVDALPPPTSENMGRIVRLSTDGRLYVCVPIG
ncbi:MAG: hypothetical protein ACTSPB_02450 [Candidatus Thorarchaeota archaeon]